MEVISIKWLAILAVATAWTTFFSLFNESGVRGWRNLGWLACYVIGLLMLFNLAWRHALATWALAGVISGLVYFLYDLVGYLRAAPDAGEAKPRLATVLNALALWPIMLPEVIEYALADLGLLKAPAPPSGQP